MSDILDAIEDLDDEFDYLMEDEDDVVVGEIVEVNQEMNLEEAQQITNAIRSSVTATYIFISQAHERKAHKALGYDTWADYVHKEFEISSSRSYQLLDLSKTIKEIEAVTPEGTDVKLTEAQARDIKRELPRITEKIEEETRDLDPEDAAEAVEKIVEEVREQQKEDQKVLDDRDQSMEAVEDELEDFEDEVYEPDQTSEMGETADGEFLELEVEGSGENLDPETEMDIYNFFSMLSALTSLPEPEDLVEVMPTDREEEIENQLEVATSWLNRFQTLWEFREN